MIKGPLNEKGMRLYDDQVSGNGYKVRLLCAYLRIPYQYCPMDILAGETRTPSFLAMNGNGRIPLLQLSDGTCLAESNSILFYLAQGSPFGLARPSIKQWLCSGCSSSNIVTNPISQRCDSGLRSRKSIRPAQSFRKSKPRNALVTRRSRSWNLTYPRARSLWVMSSPLRMSPFMPTPTWPVKGRLTSIDSLLFASG